MATASVTVVCAPNRVDRRPGDVVVFLAGSTGTWRKEVIAALQTDVASGGAPLMVLDPQRDDWDASWREDASDARFREQIMWELDGLAMASFVAVALLPDTLAPVSLLELGLNIGLKTCVVYCHPNYAKQGHIALLIERHPLALRAASLSEMAQHLRRLHQTWKEDEDNDAMRARSHPRHA